MKNLIFFFLQNLNIQTRREITEPELKIPEPDPNIEITEWILYLYTEISKNLKYSIRTQISITTATPSPNLGNIEKRSTTTTCGVLCNLVDENRQHLFFDCPFSSRVWSFFMSRLHLSPPMLFEDGGEMAERPHYK